MRPISLPVVCEVLRELGGKTVTPNYLSQKLRYSRSRAKEILKQLTDMKLIKEVGIAYKISEFGRKLLEAYYEGDLSSAHEILLNYPPYSAIFSLLKDEVYSVAELSEILGFNEVEISIILRLMRHVGIPLRKGLKEDFYIEKESLDEVSFHEFEKFLEEEFHRESKGKLSKYVRISLLRDATTYKMRISQGMFIKLLERYIKENPGKVTLSPAPYTTWKNDDQVFSICGKRYVFIKIR